MMRLTALDQVPAPLRPGYDPLSHGGGIVHLGLGAFHKAHQAALTDLAMAASGGNWRILAVSLRSERAVAEIAPQNGLTASALDAVPAATSGAGSATDARGNKVQIENSAQARMLRQA